MISNTKYHILVKHINIDCTRSHHEAPEMQ